MTFRKLVMSGLFTVVLAAATAGGVGESAVITLVFPFGARTIGMGEVGTSLANDATALFWNPAGLGVRNPDWRRGSVTGFFERLLPAFDLDGLWHLALAGCYQTPGIWGGLGAYYNYINMGKNQIVDAVGRPVRNVHSSESVFALGWGFSFAEVGDSTRNVGMAFKPFISALAPGMGEGGDGVARSFAVDVGYLRVLQNGLRVGVTIANMGPDIYYLDRNNCDPIPQTLNVGVGYKRRFIVDNIDAVRVAAELRFDKELVINHYDGDPDPFYKALFVDLFNEPIDYELQEINYHLGCEVGIFNTGFLRQGLLIDYIGERYELHVGLGFRLFNHFQADFGTIIAPEGFLGPLLRLFNKEKDGATGARHGQWKLSITIDALAGGHEEDMEWWLVDRERDNW